MALYTIDCACDNQAMKATKLIHTKEEHAQGFVEVVIWQVPESVPPSEHSFKYRLVYIVDGKRVVGYDNERGKGDHKHINDEELPYLFTSPAQLMADFMQDIEGATQ
jgi:hypothetical protein